MTGGSIHRCRECRTELAGAAYLRFGADALRNGTAVCLSCVERLMTKGHHATLRDFTVAYVEAHRPQPELVSLRQRVTELERLLDGYTRPEPQP